MAEYCYDADNTADGARDGSQGHPFLDPSELPTPNRITDTQAEHYFRRGTSTNLSAALLSTAATTTPIVIGAWGTGAPPIVTAYRMLDASECLECDVDNSGAYAVLTIPPVGGAGSTNLWRVPKTFFGLFDGDIFGAAVDVGGRVSAGNKRLPSAAYEWCGAMSQTNATGVTDGYGVIYSVGNPVTTYGGVFVSSFDEATFYGAASEKCAFATKLARGGFEISGLDLRYMARATMAEVGTTSDTYDLARHSHHDMRLSHLYRGMGVTGDLSNAPGIQYESLRVYENYGENLGIGLFDTAGTSGTCLNDARIYRNVLNGFARAMSWGGYYMQSVFTSDGSRILVEENTACNGDAGNFWPNDGYAFYQERDSSDLEFRRNFAWNCKHNYIALWGNANVVFSNNVAIADTGDYAPASASSQFITIQSGGEAPGAHSAHRVRCFGNVGVGFRSFAKITAETTGSAYEILSNISLRGGTTRGGVFTDMVDTARLVVDGNNFYDHDTSLRLDDPWTAYDSAPEVTNKITADPSTELARLPVPTDPTVNYALQIRPGARIVSGTVDLRPGTRVVV